jgi:hypothetical protein
VCGSENTHGRSSGGPRRAERGERRGTAQAGCRPPTPRADQAGSGWGSGTGRETAVDGSWALGHRAAASAGCFTCHVAWLRGYGRSMVSSYKPPLWPVSVKAVVLDDRERILLLHNERDEWELPGGRLEIVAQETGEAADRTPEEPVGRRPRSPPRPSRRPSPRPGRGRLCGAWQGPAGRRPGNPRRGRPRGGGPRSRRAGPRPPGWCRTPRRVSRRPPSAWARCWAVACRRLSSRPGSVHGRDVCSCRRPVRERRPRPCVDHRVPTLPAACWSGHRYRSRASTLCRPAARRWPGIAPGQAAVEPLSSVSGGTPRAR